MTEETTTFHGWAVLELMGHRRLAGWLTEESIGGASFVRIDVPGDGDTAEATQFYAPAAVYCITPTTEEIARAVAKGNRPTPVTRWELAAPRHDAEEHGDPQGDEDDEVGANW